MEKDSTIAIYDISVDSERSKNTYFCKSFKVYPINKELLGGFLFGLIELNATPAEESERVFQTITSTLQETYYQQVATSPDPTKINLEAVFEFTLNRTNQRLTEMIQIGQIKLILDNLSYFIGVAIPDGHGRTSIYFTNRGQMSAQLIYFNKKSSYRIINILDDPTHPVELSERIKIFSALTSGQLDEKDLLIIATDIFSNFLSPAKILHILTNNPIGEAINYFKSQVKLVHNDATEPYNALILKNERITLPENKPLSQKSIDDFIITTERTEKLLAPSFTLNIKKHLRNLLAGLGNWTKNRQNLRQQLYRSLKTLTLATSQIPVILFNFGKNIFLYATGRKKLSRKDILTKLRNLLHGSNNPERRQLLISLIIIAAIITIGGSVYWIKVEQKNRAESEIYAAQLGRIQNILTEAESSFIYKNRERSLSEIHKASEELTYLPQATEAQKSNYRDLEKELQDLQNKIFNIEKALPQLITDLIVDGNPLNHTRLILTEDALYSYGGTNSLAKIDVKNKQIQAVLASQSPINLATTEGKTSLMITGTAAYTIGSDTLSTIELPISTTPTAIQLYNSNLFALNAETAQIIKYPAAGSAFQSGANWIKDLSGANLSGARSLTIDGGIYVLKNSGEIIKFFAGKRSDFNNPTIEPVVQDAQKIYTTVTDTNLYVFDPPTKRIIIINKAGQLIKQVLFESLTAPTDFVLDNTGKTGYLLDNNKLYRFTLN